jgi:23S rRNA pseudouridine1911/1915/1917 synthase
VTNDGAEPTAGLHQLASDSNSTERLDNFVARRLDISRTRAATLIATGAVSVNGQRERASFRPREGDRIAVDISPKVSRAVVAEQIPISIVYEDEYIAVVNKAAGMVVHPAPGNWTGTLVNALKGRVDRLSLAGGEERAGLVHRLDKDTSGLLIVAKTERAHALLGAAVAARRVARRYAALCWGHLRQDEVSVDRPIGRDPRDRKRMAIVSGGRTARTDFFRIARFDSVDLLRAHLRSGRTHQIRVHLSSIGHPVVGDDLYGGGGGRRLSALPPRRHFLHAAWLIFRHPISGVTLDLRAPLPEDLRASLLALGGAHLAGESSTAAAAEAGIENRAAGGSADLLERLGFFQVDG